MKTENFSSLDIQDALIDNLHKIGYKTMTPIQKNALPEILKKKDIIAKAKTGSGKTATFGIGILNSLDVKKFRVQSLVLCPTRELADQVTKEMRSIAKFQHNVKILTLCGGVSYRYQESSLKHQAHIIVGTPGRVLKHLRKGALSLDELEMFVLDEADRMLDMGFIEEIEEVFSFAPKQRQTLLFSATYPDEIDELSKKFLHQAISIEVDAQESSNEIDEYFYMCEASKFDTLLGVFATYKPEDVIVFCNTKIESDEVADALCNMGVDALALHGDLEQYERNDVLVQFANKSLKVLVATDVAARGLDIKELDMVVNFDIPNSVETYTHRIGRTARAGAKGVAVTLYTQKDAEKVEVYKDVKREFLDTNKLTDITNLNMESKFVTLVIEGGKKDKLRKGDILGTLVKDVGIDVQNIGKIDVYDRQIYVAVEKKSLNNKIRKIVIKKKRFSCWIL
jgi:ATP-independent RNA helicase DbpA